MRRFEKVPRPKAKATLRSTKVEGQKMAGPPKPQNLSITSTVPKNNPLYREAVLPEPGRVARPIAKEVVVFPGFYSIDQLIHQVYRNISAVDNDFSRPVSEAAFGYYVAANVYARMLKILNLSGRQIIKCAVKNGGSVVEHHSSSYWQPLGQPYFDNTTKRETTTIVGQSAYLHCRVRNLGDRAVSWIRKRDLHILTVGILTYTNDQRFQSFHSDGSDEWTLKITSPQVRDSGTYECQVSTETKISQAFNLSVVVSVAKINGNSELYIKSGSDINLTCIVLQTPEPPSFIYWYKGDHVINYSQRGGISVITEKQTRTSRLLISRALPSDSGNYTCAPSGINSTSVLVHVLNGEHPAAMQHGNSSNSGAATRTLALLLLLLHAGSFAR
ncbi:Zwei Ig domain protein zig-8 [Anthophora plagiata]